MTETSVLPVLEIRPAKGFLSLNLGEVWNYRELLYFLVWRDIKVRYKQTALGAAWAVLQPVMTMIVFSVGAEFTHLPKDGESSAFSREFFQGLNGSHCACRARIVGIENDSDAVMLDDLHAHWRELGVLKDVCGLLGVNPYCGSDKDRSSRVQGKMASHAGDDRVEPLAIN